MTIFVLTLQEGSKSQPMATTTSESEANAWSGRGRAHDWYCFELDKLDHLGLGHNGPNYAPAPHFDFELPVAPHIDEDDPLGSLRGLSQYLHSLTDSMEVLKQAVRG